MRCHRTQSTSLTERDVNHCASGTRRTLRGGVKASSSFKRLCCRLGLFELEFVIWHKRNGPRGPLGQMSTRGPKFRL